MFLTKDDLFKKDDNGFVMDGKVVGFIVNGNAYAGKLTVSNRAIYLNQTRLNGADCPDKKGMKFCWAIEPEQIEEYYIFDDEDIIKELVEIDKEVVEYYRVAEKAMADFDYRAKNVSKRVLIDRWNKECEITEKALQEAKKQHENAMSDNGQLETCKKLQEATDKRCDKSLESWSE